jgi:heat shock protein HtpX
MVNFFKTTVLLGLLTGVIVAFGYYYGGTDWAVGALALAALMNFVSYWFSDKIVLAMYRARRVERGDSPRLYGIVEKLAKQARLPMPKVYIIPDASPNAFATGRGPSHAAVAATTGILNLLGDDELAGVMAHELAHVKHRDTLIGTVAATLAGAISILARILMFGNRDRNRQGGGAGALLMMILAPIAAMLIQMAISRSREYAADAAGARICGKPAALASALARLESGARAAPMEDMGDPATSHLFIVNPFRGGVMTKLFSTHPPTEERVKRLRAMI